MYPYKLFNILNIYCSCFITVFFIMNYIAVSLMFTVNNCYYFITECAHLLLAHNAPVKVKNAQGWSPLAEAISYGDRQMSKNLCSPPQIQSLK